VDVSVDAWDVEAVDVAVEAAVLDAEEVAVKENEVVAVDDCVVTEQKRKSVNLAMVASLSRSAVAAQFAVLLILPSTLHSSDPDLRPVNCVHSATAVLSARADVWHSEPNDFFKILLPSIKFKLVSHSNSFAEVSQSFIMLFSTWICVLQSCFSGILMYCV
jgi:hypothetical protein